MYLKTGTTPTSIENILDKWIENKQYLEKEVRI